MIIPVNAGTIFAAITCVLLLGLYGIVSEYHLWWVAAVAGTGVLLVVGGLQGGGGGTALLGLLLALGAVGWGWSIVDAGEALHASQSTQRLADVDVARAHAAPLISVGTLLDRLYGFVSGHLWSLAKLVASAAAALAALFLLAAGLHGGGRRFVVPGLLLALAAVGCGWSAVGAGEAAKLSQAPNVHACETNGHLPGCGTR